MSDQWNPVKGNLVHWINGAPRNTGLISEVVERTVIVQFDSGERTPFAWPSDVLERVLFKPGERVQLRPENQLGVVLTVIRTETLAVYQISIPGGTPMVDESALRRPILTDPADMLRNGEMHRARSTNLRITATRLLFEYEFNDFSSLSNSRVEIKPHQVAVLHRVATSYPHRFLLADEVGLGKTIEAGMIIKELKARRLANRVLIMAPSGIVGQWQMEMLSKFGLAFSRYTRETVAYLQGKHPNENVWTIEDNIVTSSSYASMDEDRRRAITLAPWDLVVIDEAHHARRTLESESELKWSETQLYRLAEALARLETGGTTGLLLLTATPMQLHQFELYSLVELLDPTLFADYGDFEQNRQASRRLNMTVKQIREWADLDKSERQEAAAYAAFCLVKPLPEVAAALRTATGRIQVEEDLFSQHRLSDVLIRNRKAMVGGFMPRAAGILEVQMTRQERLAYDAVIEYVRAGYAYSEKTKNYILGFLMATFQKLNSSSSHAVRHSLIKRRAKCQEELADNNGTSEIEEDDVEERSVGEAFGNSLGVRGQASIKKELKELARIIGLLEGIQTDSKAKVLVEKLTEIVSKDDDAKVLIFTQFRDTQEYLRSLVSAPWTVHVYHGTLKAAEKDNVVSSFRDGKGPQLMISTEAGGEGRNFQFCHVMVNYDLPWNPMKVEQRIGRLDRIGQKHPVTVLNLKLLGTIEEHVLDVLDKRIRIFEETVGGLDPILGDVETEIKNIMLHASSQAEQALRRLGADLEQRVRAARKAEQRLAELIMDAKSFRQDEVNRLLDHRGTLDNRTMQGFVLGSLKELGVSVKDDPEIANVFTLRYYDRFLGQFPQFRKEELPLRVTFSPSVAIDYETVDFLAFGHKLVDALVARVRSEDYLASTSRRTIRTTEKPPTQGWFFTYVLEFEGVTPRKELLAVFMDHEGKPDDALAEWLLDRCCLIKREEWEDPVPPVCDDVFERAVSYANGRALERLSARRQELTLVNLEKLNQQKTKLERAYDHRRKAAAAKLASVKAVYERLSASEDPEVKKIVPVWAKNLENSTKHLEQAERDRERSFRDLEARREVSGRCEMLTASFVEIVEDSSSSQGDSQQM